MAVLLRLGHGVFTQVVGAQQLGERVLDHRRLDQIMRRDLQIAVVFQHTGKVDAGVVAAVELVKILAVEGEGDLLRAVAAEVIQHDAVAVGDGRYGLAVALHDKGGQVLIDAVRLGAVGFDGLLRGREAAGKTLHMGAPAGLDHRPVGLVAVHGDLHSAAAGGDGVVAALGVQLAEQVLELRDILKRGRGRHVAAVEQDVAVGALDALGMRMAQQGEEMLDVRVDVAVGQQAEEMEGLAVFVAVRDEALPRLGLEQCACLDGLADELGALRVDLAAAEGIVTDLGVAHVVISGQADGRAVRLEPVVRAGGEETVEIRGICKLYCVAGAAVALADAVHDDQDNRFLCHNMHPPITRDICALIDSCYCTTFSRFVQSLFSRFCIPYKITGAKMGETVRNSVLWGEKCSVQRIGAPGKQALDRLRER